MYKKIQNFEIVDGEVLYAVDKVVGKRSHGAKRWKVKWLGYEGHPQEYT